MSYDIVKRKIPKDTLLLSLPSDTPVEEVIAKSKEFAYKDDEEVMVVVREDK